MRSPISQPHSQPLAPSLRPDTVNMHSDMELGPAAHRFLLDSHPAQPHKRKQAAETHDQSRPSKAIRHNGPPRLLGLGGLETKNGLRDSDIDHTQLRLSNHLDHIQVQVTSQVYKVRKALQTIEATLSTKVKSLHNSYQGIRAVVSDLGGKIELQADKTQEDIRTMVWSLGTKMDFQTIKVQEDLRAMVSQMNEVREDLRAIRSGLLSD